MAIEHVQDFYKRLSSDKKFYAQLESTTSKAECKQIVQLAGYSFTDAEFEEYTAQLLKANKFSNKYLESLSERELSAVWGGAARLVQDSIPVTPYGHSPL